jgi:5-deoxy-glucuronate isomerase
MKNKKYSLMHKPLNNFGIYQSLSVDKAGWSLLNFNARIIKKGECWKENTGEYEYGIILFSGNYSVKSNKGNWKTFNGRKSVFHGIAHTLYLPKNTDFELKAESAILDIGCGYCETNEDHPAYFKKPDEVKIEIRGGDNATRQINSLIEPGFDCHKLVSVEVYTPSGNWSSFPAHKHDKRTLDQNNNLIEAKLEEIYFYKIDKSQGYAIQQIYTSDRTLNEIVFAKNNDLVTIPKGYHPVVAGHGYNVYYLNFLAGTDQSLANSDDPDHKWIYKSWKGKDPRVPMVNAN